MGLYKMIYSKRKYKKKYNIFYIISILTPKSNIIIIRILYINTNLFSLLRNNMLVKQKIYILLLRLYKTKILNDLKKKIKFIIKKIKTIHGIFQ